MATGRSRSAAALARAEAHLAQARLPGKGRQNRLPGSPETTPPLFDRRPPERPPESSPSPEASPRSLVRSLDELFSVDDDAPSDTSASTDFRANVLSLDDLAPVAASETEELKEKAVPIPATSPGAFHARDATEGDAGRLEEEAPEDPGETDISEQLSGVSGGAPSSTEATPRQRRVF
ncbi:hypothetical protein JRQ81_008785 [Phrynocephalus forsythii]|uniref:Uncharacterized protein n=1 Tax=Phrynocephalus forsythii TaxID=171643 RepID=A0A9Q0XAV6_9SAUR|nr:hypothetical protein JRQ81_008785 [Phrynocephalus forsythii]